eukprot:3257507-Rhodomonas_salina.2
MISWAFSSGISSRSVSVSKRKPKMHLRKSGDSLLMIFSLAPASSKTLAAISMISVAQSTPRHESM